MRKTVTQRVVFIFVVAVVGVAVLIATLTHRNDPVQDGNPATFPTQAPFQDSKLERDENPPTFPTQPPIQDSNPKPVENPPTSPTQPPFQTLLPKTMVPTESPVPPQQFQYWLSEQDKTMKRINFGVIFEPFSLEGGGTYSNRDCFVQFVDIYASQ